MRRKKDGVEQKSEVKQLRPRDARKRSTRELGRISLCPPKLI